MNAAEIRTLELSVDGVDCFECAERLADAIRRIPGVESADVLLGAGKALVRHSSATSIDDVEAAVRSEGCQIRPQPTSATDPEAGGARFGRSILALLGVVVAAVVFVAVVGEALGLFAWLRAHVPWPVGLALVAVGGYPVFASTVRSALRRQITSSTLMSMGAVAAVVSGEWPVAIVVVAFMRVSDHVEAFTVDHGRRAVSDLVELAPQIARVEHDGEEVEIPLAQVRPGDIVAVRPGEKIPVDGEVVSGSASVDHASITGEAIPLEAAPGARVFAATIVQGGALRIRTSRVGADTTFGRVIQMIEHAEANRADAQRLADRFASAYLPVVAVLAALTLAIRRDPSAVVAVLVVGCSCSLALATPVAILASVGAAARRGLLVKGGRYLEQLARADVVLLDKTGTLTLGRPVITDVVSLNGLHGDQMLGWAASAEMHSEHPLATAIRERARLSEVATVAPDRFRATAGVGVEAVVGGHRVEVGRNLLSGQDTGRDLAQHLEREGKTVVFVHEDGRPVGLLAAADGIRPEVPQAIEELRRLGLTRFELLTGDNERVAAALGSYLGVPYRARLLPEDKIEVVREYQASGHVVVMIGDGVNDAPALAQADVGIAMGAAGSDIAIEAAHVAVMRDDWRLVPELLRIARRTMSTVKLNLGFTVVYNLTGLSLAAMGILPPVFAAAAQSMPDFAIVANSARLLRRR